MATIRHHQGFRLKKFIDTSDKTITDIVKEIGISRATLYNWFETDELLLSKIRPVLQVIGVSENDFIAGFNEVNEPPANYGLQALVDQLRGENERLQQQVKQQQEMIEILKAKNVLYIKPKKTTK